MPGFTSFSELKNHARAGRDYTIAWRPLPGAVLVMAVHGGGIEPGTTEIADAIAGTDHGFYSFAGIRTRGNIDLHITSRRFDEPTALALAGKAEVIITIHGCKGPRPLVLLGGRHHCLIGLVEDALEKAGFACDQDPRFPGISPDNICNKGRCGQGVQVELSFGLRRMFFPDPRPALRSAPAPAFAAFVQAMRRAIEAWSASRTRPADAGDSA